MNNGFEIKKKTRFSIFMENIGTLLFSAMFFGSGLLVLIAGLSLIGEPDGGFGVFLILALFSLPFIIIGIVFGKPCVLAVIGGDLRQNGIAVKAKITEVVWKPNVYVNGVNPGYVKATYVNSKGKVITFKSANFGIDLSSYVKYGEPLTVYVNNDSCIAYEVCNEEISSRIETANMPSVSSANYGYTSSMNAGLVGTNQLTTDYNKVFENEKSASDYSAYEKIKMQQAMEAQQAQSQQMQYDPNQQMYGQAQQMQYDPNQQMYGQAQQMQYDPNQQTYGQN